MKNPLIILLLFLCSIAKAQTEKELWGEWKFESIADETGASDEKKAKAGEMFKSYGYIFYPDRQYAATLMGQAFQGKWQLKGSKLLLTNNDKPESEIEIVSIAGDKMKMKLKGLVMVMARKVTFSNPENLMHKWKFEGTRLDPDDEDLYPAPANNYIDLRTDNTYTAIVGQVNETGTWFFDEQLKSIILTANGAGKQWEVAMVNSTTLELYMNAAKTGFVFTR